MTAGLLLLAIGIVFVIALWLMSLYNGMVSYRVEADNSFSQIDVQLKRRHDLIPNLVETVKGVMNFEKDTLTQVMQARANAMGAQKIGDRVQAENELSAGLGRLMAVWENYPALKSDANARQLQEELVSTENKIAYSRGHFNDITANYNTLIAHFPAVLFAASFGFHKRDFLKAATEAEQQVPQVKL